MKSGSREAARTLLASLGSCEPADRRMLAAAGEAGMLLVLGTLDGRTRGMTRGTPDAHPRDVLDDQVDLLTELGRRHRARFLSEIRRRPLLGDSFSVLGAVSRIRGRAAADLLMTALKSRDGSVRWLALSGLIERKEPRVVPLLEKLLRDRDSLVRFAATRALVDVGEEDALPALRKILTQTRTAPGTRAAAQKAIAAIERREKRLQRPKKPRTP